MQLEQPRPDHRLQARPSPSIPPEALRLLDDIDDDLRAIRDRLDVRP